MCPDPIPTLSSALLRTRPVLLSLALGIESSLIESEWPYRICKERDIYKAHLLQPADGGVNHRGDGALCRGDDQHRWFADQSGHRRILRQYQFLGLDESGLEAGG